MNQTSAKPIGPASATPTMALQPVPMLSVLTVGLFLWFLPAPTGVSLQAWRMFALFCATITGVITRPLPVAPVVLAGAAFTVVTGVASFQELFSGFSKPSIWLIAFAFFMAHGLIKSGLASRIAYLFVFYFGRTPLGLAYSLLASELFLSPFIPSLSARSGGIIFPITQRVAEDQFTDGKPSNTSRFLLLTAFQGSAICAAMFLTSSAVNPVIVAMAQENGISITWTSWALAASVPGLICLFTLPWVIRFLIRPEMSEMPDAPKMAEQQLLKMGAVTRTEWIMGLTFLAVLIGWVAGPYIGLSSTVTLILGVCTLLSMGVISWKECLEQKNAWDTLLWLTILLSMGGQLRALGFFDFLSTHIFSFVADMPWQLCLILLGCFYFYAHYILPGLLGHVAALYMVVLPVSIQMGAPPLLAALFFGFISNLFGGLTQYASGPAPIYFGADMVSVKEWWRVGFIVGTLNVLIWIVAGALWWSFLGLTTQL